MWDLCDGKVATGPLDERAVVARVMGGLSPLSRVRPTGSGDWVHLGAHPLFARALDDSLRRLREERDDAQRSARSAWHDELLWALGDLGTAVLLVGLTLAMCLVLSDGALMQDGSESVICADPEVRGR